MQNEPAGLAVEQETRAEHAPAVSVVVPAFNEEGAVAQDLSAIKQVLDGSGLHYELIVVDDGSTDRTAENAQSVDGITLYQHSTNRGYGSAVKTGIRHARGELIVITDADGTYPAEAIPDLVADLEDCDMAVGARTGEVVQVPFLRKPAKWFITRLASYLAETRIPDLNSGLRAFRRKTAMRFFGMLPAGFSFTTTITLAMLCNGLDVRFRPIDYYHRTGKSKIRPLRDTYNFILLIIRTICYFNPLKVFLPLAFLTFLGGFGKLVLNLAVAHRVAGTEILLIVAALQLAMTGLVADALASSRAPTE